MYLLKSCITMVILLLFNASCSIFSCPQKKKKETPNEKQEKAGEIEGTPYYYDFPESTQEIKVHETKTENNQSKPNKK